MAVYIKLNDAVEEFKKAKADDKANFVKYGIFDDNSTNFFPAERAIDIIYKCHKYFSKGDVVYSYWEHKITSDGENIGICHNCKYPVSWFWTTKCCPNCGARMDEPNEPEN